MESKPQVSLTCARNNIRGIDESTMEGTPHSMRCLRERANSNTRTFTMAYTFAARYATAKQLTRKLCFSVVLHLPAFICAPILIGQLIKRRSTP